jgi:antitoxin FitA
MAALTIRNIDDAVKANARLAAARNGRSLEAEVRALLERTYRPPEDDRAARIRAMTGSEFVQHLIKVANGATLEVPDSPTDLDRDIFGAD